MERENIELQKKSFLTFNLDFKVKVPPLLSIDVKLFVVIIRHLTISDM
jgi:hypothetical protein